MRNLLNEENLNDANRVNEKRKQVNFILKQLKISYDKIERCYIAEDWGFIKFDALTCVTLERDGSFSVQGSDGGRFDYETKTQKPKISEHPKACPSGENKGSGYSYEIEGLTLKEAVNVLAKYLSIYPKY